MLFGETHKQAQKRLRQLEIEQPELKEGWNNDFQSAMNKVDEELVQEVILGSRDQSRKLNVAMPETAGEKSWDQITVSALPQITYVCFSYIFQTDACQLEKTVEPARDCDIIRSFLVHILKRWGDELNSREEAIKRSPVGKLEAGTHRQTMEHLKPLLEQLKVHSCNNDIRGHLCHIVRLCVIDRDYIQVIFLARR